MSRIEKPRASLDVLIAEDDGDIRLAVRSLLEAEGYTCAEAEDGRAAVEAARQSPPRLVLLDLMMPEVDGFAAARQLRSDPQTHDVPIHCLTALTNPAAREAAYEAGCNGYLTKPFSVDELLEAVSRGVFALRPEDDQLMQAVERLEQTLAAPVPGRERIWCKQLTAALALVEATLRRQTAAGDAEGQQSPVDLCRPSLARQVARLRRESADFLERVRGLRQQIQAAARAFRSPGEPAGTANMPGPAAGRVVDFGTIRDAGKRLTAALRRHAQGEQMVVLESMNTDIGVGD